MQHGVLPAQPKERSEMVRVTFIAGTSHFVLVIEGLGLAEHAGAGGVVWMFFSYLSFLFFFIPLRKEKYNVRNKSFRAPSGLLLAVPGRYISYCSLVLHIVMSVCIWSPVVWSPV